jgi:hypothetical protein
MGRLEVICLELRPPLEAIHSVRTMAHRFRITRLSGNLNYDVQYRLGVPHHAYLTSSCSSGYLPPFALCRPFSCALVGCDSHDYYDGSVT